MKLLALARGPCAGCANAPAEKRASSRTSSRQAPGQISGGVPPRSSSNREIAVASYGIGGERTRGARPHDASLLQDDVAVRETQQRFDGLVDDEDRQAIALQPSEALPDLLPGQRR